MIKPDMIPDEVMEAAAKALCSEDCGGLHIWHEISPKSRHRYERQARAAIAAALNAWPGVVNYRGGWEPVVHNNRKPHLILPLTQEENPDDQA